MIIVRRSANRYHPSNDKANITFRLVPRLHYPFREAWIAATPLRGLIAGIIHACNHTATAARSKSPEGSWGGLRTSKSPAKPRRTGFWEWCRLRDSNTRPPHYECDALPTELRRLPERPRTRRARDHLIRRFLSGPILNCKAQTAG